LTVIAQERRIANNAVERSFQFTRKLDWLLKVVLNKLLEDSESFVILKESEVWFACVLSAILLVALVFAAG